jgi:outer membrane receptor protein involved in Fe transport
VLKIILSSFLLLLTVRAAAQSSQPLGGLVIDSAGKSIPGINVMLCSSSDTIVTVTDGEGSYRFSRRPAGRNTLQLTYAGAILYDTTWIAADKIAGSQHFPPIVLRRLPKALEEVVVRPPPVTVKEDTIQFNAAAFNVREGASVEELIRKFPGLTVDRDGNITAQGKSVVRVKVNGKDFFAGDLQTATQNLPAEIVRNIQIIDDYGDQANLTGIKTGEPQKVININTRKDKNRGEFGNLQAGAGTRERYMASVSVNRFRDNQQVSFIGSANNTNTNPTPTGGMGKTPISNQASGAPGITRTYSAGINFRDKLSEKLSVNGSYSLSRSESEISALTFQQDLNPADIRTTNRSSNTLSQRTSHRFNIGADYALNARSLLRLTTHVSFSSQNSSNNAISTISRTRFFTRNDNTSTSLGSGADLNLNLIYNYRFKKTGRNLNISGTYDYGAPEDEVRVNNRLTDIDSAGTDSLFIQPAVAHTDQQQRQQTASLRKKPSFIVSYTEPVAKNTVLELNYSLSYEALERSRNVYDLDTGVGTETLNRSLSTDFQSTFLVSRYSLNLQSRHQRFNYLVGAVLQPSRLDGSSRLRNLETHTANTNWAPNARITYRFSGMQTLNLNYNGSYTEPDYQKIQPLVDSTNPSNILVGNPNLKPEFNNRIGISYNASDRETGASLFANASYDKTLNRIVNSVYNDTRSTSRTTTYVNDNGFYRMSGNITGSRPFNSRRFTVSAGVNGSFDNSIAYTDGQRSNGQSWSLQPNARFQADIQNVLDAELLVSYALSRAEAMYGTQVSRTDTRVMSLSLNGRIFIGKDFCIGYNYDKQINSGFGGATNISPDILNMYAEYRFTKRRTATVRLQGFDLLNQNERISRTVSGTSIIDSRTNGLRRYAILTIGWRLGRFGN